jgi:hypothetical protein
MAEVQLDQADKGDVVAVLDALDLDAQLTEQVRALRRVLRGTEL